MRVVPVGLRDGRNPLPVLVVVQERYLEKVGSLALAAGVATDKLPNYAYLSAGWVWGNVFGFGSQLELRGSNTSFYVPTYWFSSRGVLLPRSSSWEPKPKKLHHTQPADVGVIGRLVGRHAHGESKKPPYSR